MEIVRQKNVATRIVFPIVDADGDLVTGAAGLDSEIDEFADGSNPTGFADCTNEATEIGTTGIYYLNLTQTEMNQDYLVVQVKTSTSGAKTQVILIRTIVGDPLNLATSDDGGAFNVNAGVIEAQVKSIDNNVITAASIATDAITAAKIAADAIGASELAADAITEIQSGLSTLTQANIRTAVGLASANLDTQLSTIAGYIDTEVAAILAAVDTEVAAIKAKTDNLPASPAATSDIPSAATIATTVWDKATSALTTAGSIGKLLVDNINATISSRASQTSLDTLDDYVDTEVAAIKAKTDNLPSDPADASDIAAAIAGLNNLSAAQVLTQVNAALDAASTELSAVPTTTGSLRQFIQFLHAYFRNKKTVTATTETLMKEDASTTLGTSTVSDDGTTFTKGEMN